MGYFDYTDNDNLRKPMKTQNTDYMNQVLVVTPNGNVNKQVCLSNENNSFYGEFTGKFNTLSGEHSKVDLSGSSIIDSTILSSNIVGSNITTLNGDTISFSVPSAYNVVVDDQIVPQNINLVGETLNLKRKLSSDERKIGLIDDRVEYLEQKKFMNYVSENIPYLSSGDVSQISSRQRMIDTVSMIFRFLSANA